MSYRIDDSAITWLEDEGYLIPGAVIPCEVVERVLAVSYSNTWDFLGPLLALRSELEERGFFVTQRGQSEGALRLLHIDEMALHAKRRWEAQQRQVQKRTRVMLRADISVLDHEQRKKHEYEAGKLARLGLQMKDIIHKLT